MREPFLPTLDLKKRLMFFIYEKRFVIMLSLSRFLSQKEMFVSPKDMFEGKQKSISLVCSACRRFDFIRRHMSSKINYFSIYCCNCVNMFS